MSSIGDPAKLKVVELRAELSKRGLDSKGNKPALVKRLKDALEEELKEELPDTSIADTSTEDLDSSLSHEQPVADESKVSNKEIECTEKQSVPPVGNTTQTDIPEVNPPVEKMETEVVQPQTEQPTVAVELDEPNLPDPIEPDAPESAEPNIPETVDTNKPETPKEDAIAEDPVSDNNIDQVIPEENQENGDQDEPKSRKSRWAAEETDDQKLNEIEAKTNQSEVSEVSKTESESESKGEKRKRGTPSPDRSQRRRSKSPIKEDEPPIDSDKVQLSWYDSDLHLQLDKESFLSAKPYHEGAFGFAWAGVRATHGVKSGKVCFEVKITEELKWEDFSKYYEKHRRDQHKSTRHKSDDDKKKSEDDTTKKSEESEEKKDDESKEEKTEEAQSENGEKSEELPPTEESMEVSEAEKPEDETKTVEKSEELKAEEVMESEEIKDTSEPLPTHLFRVGWSLSNTTLQLGEDKYSYGYESTGLFVTDKQFREYGVKFGVGDVIASYLHFDENKFTITYAVNGVTQSEAISVSSSEISEDFVLFPHVLSRNYTFELNFGSREDPWFPSPATFEEFQFLDKVEDTVAGPVRPESRTDCEVILMCGLPASGKTHWVKEYLQSNPEKTYTLLGNTHLLEKMTVSGDALKSKFKGSWNILLDKLQKSLNKLVELAALRRRNYIIDQTNVFPSAQRRKLRPFEGFKRRAVVVVVGDEEQAKRQSLQEAQDGKDVPDSAVLEMKANMSLPQKGEWIDEVIYAGVGEDEAKTIVQKYNTQGRDAGYGIQRRFSHRDDRHRWQNRRNDYRGNYRDRNYHNNRYDRGPPRQNWHPQRPGGWNRDRRDNRGPPMGGSRDWRNNRGNGRDRNNRDGQGNNYNRNRNQPGRGPGGNWQSGGNWGGQNQGWNNQPWNQGSWGQGGWGGQANQNQWKYGGGNGGGGSGGNNQGYGGYTNWSYYGQYPQNWNPTQGQTQTTSAAGSNQYGQYSQQEWAQYAQQYAQQGQSTPVTTTTQSITPQK